LKALQRGTHFHLRPLKKEMKQREGGAKKNAQNLDVILKGAKTKKEKLIKKGSSNTLSWLKYQPTKTNWEAKHLNASQTSKVKLMM
jgi:hypothetical protein